MLGCKEVTLNTSCEDMQMQFVQEETRYNWKTKSNREYVYMNWFYCRFYWFYWHLIFLSSSVLLLLFYLISTSQPGSGIDFTTFFQTHAFFVSLALVLTHTKFIKLGLFLYFFFPINSRKSNLIRMDRLVLTKKEEIEERKNVSRYRSVD